MKLIFQQTFMPIHHYWLWAILVQWSILLVYTYSHLGVVTALVFLRNTFILTWYMIILGSFSGCSTAWQETQEIWVQSLGREVPLEEGMATYSSILASRILWTEEPGRLQSMGLQRVKHNWIDFTLMIILFYFLKYIGNKTFLKSYFISMSIILYFV